MVNQFMVTSRASTRGTQDCIYACSGSSGRVERQDTYVTYVLTGGVQLVLSKCIRKTDQGWSKHLPTNKNFNAYSWEYQTNFGGRIIATKRGAEALAAVQTNISREHVTLKFKNKDAEAVMAKALEGGSDSKKEEPLFPEPMAIPAPLEIPVEAMKRDGGERKPHGEETPSKTQKVLFTDEKTLEKVKAFRSTSLPAGQPNPITPILSSLRSPSAPSRPREAFELLEEETPTTKLRPSDDSSKNAKINLVKIGKKSYPQLQKKLLKKTG